MLSGARSGIESAVGNTSFGISGSQLESWKCGYTAAFRKHAREWLQQYDADIGDPNILREKFLKELAEMGIKITFPFKETDAVAAFQVLANATSIDPQLATRFGKEAWKIADLDSSGVVDQDEWFIFMYCMLVRGCYECGHFFSPDEAVYAPTGKPGADYRLCGPCKGTGNYGGGLQMFKMPRLVTCAGCEEHHFYVPSYIGQGPHMRQIDDKWYCEWCRTCSCCNHADQGRFAAVLHAVKHKAPLSCQRPVPTDAKPVDMNVLTNLSIDQRHWMCNCLQLVEEVVSVQDDRDAAASESGGASASDSFRSMHGCLLESRPSSARLASARFGTAPGNETTPSPPRPPHGSASLQRAEQVRRRDVIKGKASKKIREKVPMAAEACVIS